MPFNVYNITASFFESLYRYDSSFATNLIIPFKTFDWFPNFLFHNYKKTEMPRKSHHASNETNPFSRIYSLSGG